jgi:hypothetical protein
LVVSVVLSICALPIGWAIPQLVWIEHRHEFLERDDVSYEHPSEIASGPTPWQLGLFGEKTPQFIWVPPSKRLRARELFAGANIEPD